MSAKSLSRQLLEFAAGLVLTAFLLTWAWSLLRPLLPVLVVAAIVGVFVRWLIGQRRQW